MILPIALCDGVIAIDDDERAAWLDPVPLAGVVTQSGISFVIKQLAPHV